MKWHKLTLVFLFILTGITGCYINKSFVSFETLEPAKFTYPQHVQKVAYLNRSQISRNNITLLLGSLINTIPGQELNLYNLFLADSSRDEKLRVAIRDSIITRDNALVIMDTLLNRSLLHGFVEALQTASGMQSYMDSILYIDARFANDTLYQSRPLDFELREDMMEKYGLDALISQDYYNIIIGHNGNYVTGSDLNEFVVYGTVKWCLYFKGKLYPVNESDISESFYYSYDPKETGRPMFETILRDGMKNFGYAYGIDHVPVWVTTTRTIYTGPGIDLANAALYTDSYNWDEAVRIWTGLLNHWNRGIAAKARHNLAVYNEMNDNVESAMSYLKQEDGFKGNRITKEYLEVLEKRKSKIHVINVQVR